MKKLTILTLIISASIAVLLSGCDSKNDSDKIKVAVSIVPQKAFVEAVAGDLVDVVVIIPPGSSPANYQPTPKEMIELAESEIYFSIGVNAEEVNILPNIVKDTNLKVVSLHESVSAVYPDRYFEDEHDEDEHEDHEDHDHEGRDPHIWLSPKRVIIIIEEIRDQLILIDSANETTYTENAELFIEELLSLDKQLTDSFDGNDEIEFIIMHPSLGYFADDYNLHMHAIEQDGKSATAEGIQSIIDIAKDEQIKVIFYQAEFDSSQAKTIADEIDGKVVEIAPLSEDYLNNMKKMAQAFLEEN